MPIRVLPPEVSNKIAAGEVVERPASVVKELVENAFDAGADDIRVELLQGGRRLIRVADNGCGIPTDQAALAFERHATSKLEQIEDLFHVRTLGFRGEALAAIASVSRLTLATRAREEEIGTLLRLEGGQIVARQAHARPPGTLLTVENLFYNTPARLKFLRTDATEASHAARLLTAYALAFPEKRLALEHNGRQVLATDGSGAMYDVLVALYGLDVAEQMIAVGEQPAEAVADAEGLAVYGYIGGPALHRANRNDLIFYVNHRWVQDAALSYAVAEAYRTLLPQGRHPMVVLHIALPPELVDVNIHPTKREVRFRQREAVFGAVQKAVRGALLAQRPVPVVNPFPAPTAPYPWGAPVPSLEQTRLTLEALRGPEETLTPGGGPLRSAGAPTVEPPQAGSSAESPPTERLPMLRVVGQVALTYLVAEGPGGLYLIDQHAAHERIRYEQLHAQHHGAGVASQDLLEPLTVALNPEQAALLEEHLPALADWGLVIEPFGGQTYLVRRVPASLAGENVAAALAELLETALVGGADFSWEEAALVTLACHTAVRAGQALSEPEMRDLVRQLERCALPHTCPHGRPTMIHLSQGALERYFGRQ